MATITLQITLQQTFSSLQGSQIDAITAWINANITAKLPSGATVSIVFTNITP